jgi:hypothetical protein
MLASPLLIARAGKPYGMTRASFFFVAFAGRSRDVMQAVKRVAVR